jgi:hypothetical protein
LIPTADGDVERVADGTLDIAHHLCSVSYQMGPVQETHRMRYFFPLELDLLLSCTGFERLRIGAFPEFSREPDENTWNVLVAARAIG